MARMTSESLLRLMHRNHPGPMRPRRLIVVGDGFDWEDRPEPPPHPGTWIGGIKGPGYYRFHPRDSDMPDDVRSFLIAESRYSSYPRDWPDIPGKAARQALQRGWLAPDADGLIAVTPEGRAHWHLIRFGRAEGSLPPPRRSRKRRPQGLQMTFSMYRWHVQGRNRRGSVPLPAPHLR